MVSDGRKLLEKVICNLISEHNIIFLIVLAYTHWESNTLGLYIHILIKYKTNY